MSPRTRRGLLAGVGALLPALAGCSGESLSGRQVHLDPVSPTEAPAPLRVYPGDLREPLREAALTGETRRFAARTPVPGQAPVLGADRFARPRLTGAGEADGVYAAAVDAGVRYELIVGAEQADPPPDAAVTPAADLRPERRELVRKAVDGQSPRVYPETPLGEWVREEFFDGYVSVDGTVYRGREVQQTDAAFFSREVWYVLSLSPAPDADPTVELDLRPVPDAVRDALDPVLEERRPDQSLVSKGTVEPDVARFARDTPAVLVHTATFAVGLRSTEG
ncbi:MAG: hypothetical protein ABEH47_04615 [Haloferacaceae archaeon]